MTNMQLVRGLLRDKYAHNILNCYHAADRLTQQAGAVWYAVEGERCAAFGAKRGRSRSAIAGAAAAISPGLRWEHTFSYLDALIRDPAAKVPTYNREFVRRASLCLRGADPLSVLSGDKTTAFFLLLDGQMHTGPYAPVVVDGHAFNIAQAERHIFRVRPGFQPPAAARIWPERYALVAAAYRQAAEVLRIAPHAVQATTWIYWRELHKERGIK